MYRGPFLQGIRRRERGFISRWVRAGETTAERPIWNSTYSCVRERSGAVLDCTWRFRNMPPPRSSRRGRAGQHPEPNGQVPSGYEPRRLVSKAEAPGLGVELTLCGTPDHRAHHPMLTSLSAVQGLLNDTLRVTITDGRIFLGTFVGTDSELNILLLNTDEFRLGPNENPNGRFVGQVMIPWRLVNKVEARLSPQSPDGMFT